MTPGKTIALAAMLVAVCAAARGAEPAKTGYHVTNKYTIGGDAGWDYVAVDPEDRRVYVTHHRSVEVLDADTGKVVGRITNMNGARGVALVKSIGKGFATNGKTDSVIVVDLKTLERIGEIKAGKKPDATIYDPGTDRVFVNNGDSDDMTVIDPKAGKVVGTIPLGGGPEFLAADGKGTVWTNLFDKGAFVTIGHQVAHGDQDHADRPPGLRGYVHAPGKREDNARRQDAGFRFKDREAFLRNRGKCPAQCDLAASPAGERRLPSGSVRRRGNREIDTVGAR
jgi:YVTN family beta-propeller protein